MNQSATRSRLLPQALRSALLLALASSIAACSGGGGGGPDANPPNTGVLQPDLHGDTPATATRILPDQGSIIEAINHPGDVDWFKYKAVAGVVYVLQISGFNSQFPDIEDRNANLNGDFGLLTAFFLPNASTQEQTTAGNLGGTPFDVNIAGIDDTSIIGDSRIFWIAPTTGTHYFRLTHNRTNGIGNYHVNLASSHFGQTQDLQIARTDWRAVIVPGTEDDDPPFFVNEYVQMAVGPVTWDLTLLEVGFGGIGIREEVFLIEEDEGAFVFAEDPEPITAHVHVGYPNILEAHKRLDATDGDGHAVAAAIELVNTRGDQFATEAVYTSADSSQFRFPVRKRDEDWNLATRGGMIALPKYTIDFGARGSRQAEIIAPDIVRLLVGWPFFIDAHYTTNFDLEENLPWYFNRRIRAGDAPIAVSAHLADSYSIFETPLVGIARQS
jgi:hypothetical protein